MHLLRSNRSKCNVNSGRYCCVEFNMGLFILRWRTPGRSENPSVHIFNLLFYLDHVYIITEETCLAGLPSVPWEVTLSQAFTIFPINVSRWGNPPSQGCVHVTFASALTTSRNFTSGSRSCKIVCKHGKHGKHGLFFKHG